jgi:hypothetical protein
MIQINGGVLKVINGVLSQVAVRRVKEDVVEENVMHVLRKKN